jgi:tetratricopeptide (TPR) repeat protein
LTGRLPLAIRLIGGRLAARPNWPIRHLVDLLEDQSRRLDGLGSDVTGVRASIASSVQFLETSDRSVDREAARALPMLSVPDGQDLITIVAARLLDVPLQRADAILERLVDLNLLDSVAPERYRLHDLIRAYGRELAGQTLTPDDQNAVLERILRFYTGVAWACQALTHPASPRLSLATVHAEPMPALADKRTALVWLDDEHRNLMERFRQAITSPLARSVLLPELVLALFGYHEARRRWVEMRELGQGMVELAQQGNLLLTAAWLQHDSAIPEVENGDLETAASCLFRALEMFREQSDRDGQARCFSSLTYVLGGLGRIDEALEFGKQALALSQERGDMTVEGVSYLAVGSLYNLLGDRARADDAFARGVALAESAGDSRSVIKRCNNIGFSHLVVGRYQDAVPFSRRSLELAEQAHDDVAASECHQVLALAFAAQGEYRVARSHAEAGLAMARTFKDGIREGRLLLELARISAAAGEQDLAISNASAAVTALAGVSPIHASYARTLLAQLRRGDPYSYEFTTHSI